MDKIITLLDEIQDSFDKIHAYSAEAREKNIEVQADDMLAIRKEMELINKNLATFYALNKHSKSGNK